MRPACRWLPGKAHEPYSMVESAASRAYGNRAMMTFLHQLQRSRRLRVIGLLAWVALVLQGAAALAQPPASPVMAATAMSMASGSPAHAPHAMAPTPQDGCCADHADAHHCTCASMCASVLPLARVGLPAAPLMLLRFGRLRVPHAPAMAMTPPLRPPSV